MDGAEHIPPHIKDDFIIKGAALRQDDSGRTDAPALGRSTTLSALKGKRIRKVQQLEIESCTICLEPISERAVATPCNHLTFDFLCLVSWLQDHSTCPLCKAKVEEVQYDWRSPEDYKTYHVAGGTSQGSTQTALRRRQLTPHTPVGRARRGQRLQQRPLLPAATLDDLEKRRGVYRRRTPSKHVGANRTSQYRDFTPSEFARSSELQSRARMFLRRELQVFTFLDSRAVARGNGRDFLLEYIVAILKSHEPKGSVGQAEDLVAEFLGRENARLLLHELDAWLRSPYTALEAWDNHVQYAGKRVERGLPGSVG